MRTHPTTIVVAAPDPASAASCLHQLQAACKAHDRIILVTAEGQELRKEALLGGAHSNLELRAARGGALDLWRCGMTDVETETTVFLDARMHLSKRWLEPLLHALDDTRVLACGPRIPALTQPEDSELTAQVVAVRGERQGLRRVMREWQQHHAGELVSTATLHPACIAVRSCVLRTAPYDRDTSSDTSWENAELSDLIDLNDGLLYRADEVVAVVDEHTAAAWLHLPLISACLIVRDEELNLPDCLESLQGVADEVVVYDTGSTDTTRQIARDAGATVIEGFWDDDFARARNEAKRACTGRWVLWVDADERVTGDKTALRHRLAARRTPIAYNVPIENLKGSGAGARETHAACRLFQRPLGHWKGRLHEQVVDATGSGIGPIEHIDDIRLEHLGYLDAAMHGRDKANRNLRIAQSDLDEPGIDRSYGLMNLGRSLYTAGRFPEAIDQCKESATTTTNPTIKRLALRTGADALTALGRTDEALAWISQLREASQQHVLADFLEAGVRAVRGELEQSLQLLDRLKPGVRDDDGFEYASEGFSALRATVLEGLGRPGDAADVMLSTLRDHGVLDAHLARLVECLRMDGRGVDEIARAAPSGALQLLVAQALQLHPLVADEMLRSVHVAHPEDLRPLAAAATLAPHLPVELAMFWSAALRQRGLIDACPLRAITANSDAPRLARLQAAAIAYVSFNDVAPLEDARRALTDAEDPSDLLAAIERLSPEFERILVSPALP